MPGPVRKVSCERPARLFRFARGLGPSVTGRERRWTRRPIAPARLIVPRQWQPVYRCLGAGSVSQGKSHGACLAGGMDGEHPVLSASAASKGGGRRGRPWLETVPRLMPAAGREDRPAEPALPGCALWLRGVGHITQMVRNVKSVVPISRTPRREGAKGWRRGNEAARVPDLFSSSRLKPGPRAAKRRAIGTRSRLCGFALPI